MAAAAPITLKEALLVRDIKPCLAIAFCALDWVFRKLLGLHLILHVRIFWKVVVRLRTGVLHLLGIIACRSYTCRKSHAVLRRGCLFL